MRTAPASQPPSPTEALRQRFRALLGTEHVLSEPGDLLPYATDAMPLQRGRPALVLLPGTTNETVAALRFLHEAELPWVGRGAGTGLTGGAVPSPDSPAVVLALTRLRRILEIQPTHRRVRVEPGTTPAVLNDALAPHGLCFAPDPDSHRVATIGGLIAANAGGPRAYQHGLTGRHVSGVRLALADGSVIPLGGAEETPPGYDLLALCVGSEGTLGCVVEATLRAAPIPEEVGAFAAYFRCGDDAAAAVQTVMRSDIALAALELSDETALQVLAEGFALRIPPGVCVSLVGEVSGLHEGVEDALARVTPLLGAHGAIETRVALEAAERARLWSERRLSIGALGRVAPHALLHDAAVPRTALPAAVATVRDVARGAGLSVANVLDAAGGHLSAILLFDARDPDQSRRAREAGREIMAACTAAGGLLAGRYGIGLTWRDEMPLLFTEPELQLMHRLRRAFDPRGRVNRGKMLPHVEDEGDAEGIDEEGIGRVRRAGSADGAPPAPPRRTGRRPTAPETRVLDAIAEAARARRRVIPLGGGSLIVAMPAAKNDAASTVANGPDRGPDRHPLPLETWSADRVLRFDAADHTLSVEAGVTLATAERVVAEAGQRLIWEAPDPEHATLGGVVASGYWSSLATGFGHPKHSLLGFRGVTGEGDLIAFGGRTIQGAGGYDVGKLMVGSRGTLAVLTQLTLRTYPMPAREATAIIEGSYARLLDLGAALAERGLGWTCIDLFSGPGPARLLVGLDGCPGEVARRWREVQEAAGRGPSGAHNDAVDRLSARLCEGPESVTAREAARTASAWRGSPLVLRLVVSPGHTREVFGRVQALCAAGEAEAWEHRLHALPAVGLARVIFGPRFDEVRLRRLMLDLATAVREAGGYRALDRAPNHPWWGWDCWGVPALLRDHMRRIQGVLDPQGVLAPWITA